MVMAVDELLQGGFAEAVDNRIVFLGMYRACIQIEPGHAFVRSEALHQ